MVSCMQWEEEVTEFQGNSTGRWGMGFPTNMYIGSTPPGHQDRAVGPGVGGFATRRGRHFLGTRLFPESTFLLVYILLGAWGGVK